MAPTTHHGKLTLAQVCGAPLTLGVPHLPVDAKGLYRPLTQPVHGGWNAPRTGCLVLQRGRGRSLIRTDPDATGRLRREHGAWTTGSAPDDRRR